MGSTQWDGACLEFVYQGYLQAGVDITTQAGAHDTALDFWTTYSGAPPSDTPPAGALVFWDATPNSAGHVATSEGKEMAVSADERSYPGRPRDDDRQPQRAGLRRVGLGDARLTRPAHVC